MATSDGREMAAIFGGGAIGASARAVLVAVCSSDATQWPWTTFGVNITGALMLGYFATRLQERLPLSSYRRPLLGTGLCGALTTFSTMQVEVIAMLTHDAYELASAYTAASVLAGLFAVHVASAVVRRVLVRV